jgi:GH24 family phage-related lysozyme (muramidase)
MRTAAVSKRARGGRFPHSVSAVLSGGAPAIGVIALLATLNLAGCNSSEKSSGSTPKTPSGLPLRVVYDKGMQLTREIEGFRGSVYNDAARNCSIGYGHKIKKSPCDGSEPPDFQRGITEPKAGALLTQDMEPARLSVMTVASVKLSDGQYAALCDFTYNVGAANFKGSTLLKLINQGDFDKVPAQFRRWVVAAGREVDGLRARREREIELFFDGMAIPRAAPSPDEDLSPIDIGKGE